MKTSSKKKSASLITDFDPVKMMREIRDELTSEIKNMSFAEEKAYLKKLLAKKNK